MFNANADAMHGQQQHATHMQGTGTGTGTGTKTQKKNAARAAKELAEVKQRIEAGRKGGRTTQSKRALRDDDPANVKRTPKQTSSDPPSESVAVGVEEEGGEQGARGSGNARARDYKSEAEFEQWYGGYPHKVGRAAASRAFFAARAKGVDLETLIRALDRYIRTKPPDRAWCNPATWLNQERWLDEPAQVDLRAAARPPPEHGFAGVARTLMEQDNGKFQ